VGTSLGTVLVISLTLALDTETRRREPVIVSPSGTIFRLKGSILAMSFLDCNGILIPAVADQWKETAKEEKKTYCRQQSTLNYKARESPTSSVDIVADRQFAIICSEKQARVISLPSQTCAYKVKITETSVVTKADIIAIKESVCLAVFLANGHIMTFSLPSLKPLLDCDYLPFPEIRVSRTFCFSNNGHAIHLCSPTELQKLTLSAEECENLKDMTGDLFQPCNMPEAPRQNFFVNLFIVAISSTAVDREELFGESSGKPSKLLTKYTPGPAGMNQAQEGATSAASEISRARLAAQERGQRLGELDEQTERMKIEAEAYASSSHQLKQKYKDKKWYQF
jgi:syntaxin-binding protein 5